ncbi:MAG: response regulator [Oligoflexales bacterium]|nr:response regulator [Oligoflexales bacterium]
MAPLAPATNYGLVTPRKRFCRKHVLDDRFLASRLLSMLGAVVETAEDGNEAVEKAQANEFDIILMEISRCPKMDGLKATSILREKGFKNLSLPLRPT